MRVFTEEELRKFDGGNGLAYVAYGGKVYDVSESFHWRGGIHQVTHPSGTDLTDALDGAPHGPDSLAKFPIVGELAGAKDKTVEPLMDTDELGYSGGPRALVAGGGR